MTHDEKEKIDKEKLDILFDGKWNTSDELYDLVDAYTNNHPLLENVKESDYYRCTVCKMKHRKKLDNNEN